MDAVLIHQLFGAIDACDWQRLAALLHPSIRYERPGYEALEGRARVLAFYERERVVERGEHRLEGIVLDGAAAACWGRFVGVSRGGDPLDEQFADVYRFEEGQVRMRRTHFFRAAI